MVNAHTGPGLERSSGVDPIETVMKRLGIQDLLDRYPLSDTPPSKPINKVPLKLYRRDIDAITGPMGLRKVDPDNADDRTSYVLQAEGADGKVYRIYCAIDRLDHLYPYSYEVMEEVVGKEDQILRTRDQFAGIGLS